MVKGFADYVMRGRMQAILVTVITIALSLLIPPLSHISGGVLALRALLNGLADGFWVAFGAGLVITVALAITPQGPLLAPGMVAVIFGGLWLPVLVAAQILRQRRSLERALVAVALYSLAVVVLFHALVGDVEQWWRGLFATGLLETMSGSGVDEGEITAFVDTLAANITGFLGAMLAVGVIVSLFIGRWLQAVVVAYRHGFRDEFHRLRFGKGVALGAMGVAVASALPMGGAGKILGDMALVMMAIYMFHGLALVHAMVHRGKIGRGWLYGLYLLLAFLPQTMVVLAAAGFTDSWIDFRRQATSSDGGEGGGGG